MDNNNLNNVMGTSDVNASNDNIASSVEHNIPSQGPVTKQYNNTNEQVTINTVNNTRTPESVAGAPYGNAASFATPQNNSYIPNGQTPQSNPYMQNMQAPQGNPYMPNMQTPQGNPYMPNMQAPQGNTYMPNAQMPQGGPFVDNGQMPQGSPYYPGGINTPPYNTGATNVPKKRKGPIIIVCALIIAVVVAAILLLSDTLNIGSHSYKKPLDNFIKGIETQQEKLIEEAFLPAIWENSYTTPDSFIDSFTTYEGDMSLKNYDVMEEEKCNDNAIMNIEADALLYYNENIDITDAYRLKFKVTINDSSYVDEIYSIEVDGDWYLYFY